MHKYRSSIHTQFDLPDPYLLDRYVLTPSHAKVMTGVLEGICEFGDKHAHLMIGPYGTGKSLVSTILSQVLSRQFPEEWHVRLQGQAERIDTKLSIMLRETNEKPITYIPVLINGKSGTLAKIMSQAIQHALQQADQHIITASETTAILQAVDRWKEFYPEAYLTFLKYLGNLDVQEDYWRSQIKACNEEMIRQFIAFYPSVTAGTTWSFDYESNFIENLGTLAGELESRQLGLFIVYDEFGRFLQSLDTAELFKNMQDLQTLAEFTDRAPNIHLLLVSHKHIRQYAAGDRESIRNEFEKIEGRFRHYTMENDLGTYLQLAQEALRPLNEASLGDGVDLESVEQLKTFPLFGELGSYQLEYGLLTRLYPVHPVTVLLLPQLSNIYGQNERTLFSFLSDNERDSLTEHAKQRIGYYYADRLFHFFQLETAEVKEQSALELYHSVSPYVDNDRPLQLRIIEFMTMWSDTRLTQKQPLSILFLALALGTMEADMESELRRLADAKIVRYNSTRGQWELFNGSSIDVEQLLAEKLSTISVRNSEYTDILERHLPMSYIWPYDYNDKMDMLRYADICFTSIKELRQSNEKDWPGDDRVWFVIYEDRDCIDDPDAVMQDLNQTYLVAFPAFSMEVVIPYLMRYKVIEQFLQDPVLLALDTRLKNELLYLQGETSLAIQAFVNRYFDFEKLEWRSGSERVTISHLHELELRVSLRMEKKYPYTPVIRNEAFNRSRITAIQRRALIDVIDRLIQSPLEPSLGIDGYGPNYLIYATALKNNNYRIEMDGTIRCNETLEAIRDGLINRLHREPIGKLSDLIEGMKEAPYGIRSSVVPLLFVALLRDHWDQLLFYSHDMMISQLSGVSILEMMEQADSFEYRFYQWSAEERDQLLEAGIRLQLPLEACRSFIVASELILHWLRGLSKFAQISQQLTPETLQIRDWIRSTEVDPYTYMRSLVADVDALSSAKEELEDFLRSNERELEQRILTVTGQKSMAKFIECIRRSSEEAIGKNSKLMTLSLSSDLPGVIDHIAEHLVGVPRTDWSDSTQELFLSQVKYEWELLMAGSEVAVARDLGIDVSQPLSKKSQTIYANVKNMMKYAGRDVSTQEMKLLLAKLLSEL